MYRIEDTVSAIKELQRMLGLNQSGVYDKKTRDEVKDFQKRHSLPVDGITNYTTFVMIVEEYKERQKMIWDNNYLFAPKFPYREGNMGDNVRRINDAIAKVLKYYRYEAVLPRGNYLGKETLDGVSYLQGIFSMQQENEIGELFMNRIMIELDGIEIKEILSNK